MTRFVCEGIRVRIDDVFAGSDNGKEFYLNLGSFNGDIKSFESVEDMEDIKLQFQLNDGRDYSGELKDLIVESVIQVLEKQEAAGQRPKGRTPKLISNITGISESYARMYCKNRNQKTGKSQPISKEQFAKRRKAAIRKAMRNLMDILSQNDWTNLPGTLSQERKLADELIETLQKTIIEEDEKMKKMTVDYLLEDCQCAYLGRIHKHFPSVSEEDLFMMIMIEGSSLDISEKMHSFAQKHCTGNEFKYHS